LKRITGLYLRKGKRKDTWILDFLHEGIRHKVRIGSHLSESAAAEIAMVKKTAILKGEAGIGGKKRKDISFEDARKLFEEWAAANKRPGTAKFYGYCLNALEKSFKGMKLSQISPFLIEKHKQGKKKKLSEISASHVEKHKQGREAAAHEVGANRELSTLKRLFNLMIQFGKYEGENPVRKVKHFNEPHNKVRHLSGAEEARLLAKCEEPLKTVVLVGIYAGLRISSEALTLKWSNVDLDKQQLTVEAAYAKNGTTETLPIASRLVEALRGLKERARGEFVFARKNGKPIQSVREAFTSACRRAKLTGVTPHTLRHTFASRLAMSAGVSDVTLQKLGRWKEPKMIRRYAHLSEEHLREAVEKIGEESHPVIHPARIALS
jgi:integrase